MTGLEWTLIILVMVFGFYMAWSIGANDVANAMGTSVGSRALTLKQAVIAAGIFEFLGAYVVGANVSDTVRKKMFDPMLLNDLYPAAEYGEGYGALILACGMIAALIAAGTWLIVASYFGLPVSTSHSIVGVGRRLRLCRPGCSGDRLGHGGPDHLRMGRLAAPFRRGGLHPVSLRAAQCVL